MITKILDQGNSGHRADWYTQISQHTNSKDLQSIKNYGLKSLIEIREPLIISFFDENKYFFLLIVLIRKLLFRKTIALYFSWTNRWSPNKYSLKFLEYYLFYICTFIFNIKLITPFLKKSKRFLIDFSYFDIEKHNIYNPNKKYFLSFFGSASDIKNFKLFLECADAISSDERKILVQTNSTLSPISLKMIQNNPNIDLINKFVSKEQYLKNMSSTTIVWSFYRKDYDQTSGIFGHAHQLGKKILIRSGSLLSGFNSNNIIEAATKESIIKELNSKISFHDSYNQINLEFINQCKSYWNNALRHF